MRCQFGQLPPHRFGVCVCGIVARLGLESTGDRVEPEWASALRAMESDFYITATAGIRYTFTHMVAVRVTDPLDNALDILCQLAIIVPNKNNNSSRPTTKGDKSCSSRQQQLRARRFTTRRVPSTSTYTRRYNSVCSAKQARLTHHFHRHKPVRQDHDIDIHQHPIIHHKGMLITTTLVAQTLVAQTLVDRS